MHWRPELAYLPCLLNLKRRRSNCLSQGESLGRSLHLLCLEDRDNFTKHVMFPIKGSLRHFFQNLRYYSVGCRNWKLERFPLQITEFPLGQAFLMLKAFLFRRVKIDIHILMMARTLVKQVGYRVPVGVS